MGIVNETYNALNYEENMRKWIEERKRQGISQKEVAIDMKCTESTISYVEHFKRRSFAAYYYYKAKFGGGT